MYTCIYKRIHAFIYIYGFFFLYVFLELKMFCFVSQYSPLGNYYKTSWKFPIQCNLCVVENSWRLQQTNNVAYSKTTTANERRRTQDFSLVMSYKKHIESTAQYFFPNTVSCSVNSGCNRRLSLIPHELLYIECCRFFLAHYASYFNYDGSNKIRRLWENQIKGFQGPADVLIITLKMFWERAGTMGWVQSFGEVAKL